MQMSKDKKQKNQLCLNKEIDIDAKKKLRNKRIVAVFSAVVILLLVLWTVDVVTKLITADGGIGKAAENFRDLILSYGSMGALVALGIQVLQVIVSPIPGQVVEVGMGMAYGEIEGSLMCLLGSAIASFLIMIFVKKFGVKFVELFVSIDRINDIKIINSEKKLETAAFILFFIPGTPKDPLIFFFGVTKIKTWRFVAIQTIARAPAIFATTYGGKLLAEGHYTAAVVTFIIIGGLAIAGMLCYNKLLKFLQHRKENKNEEIKGN